MEISQMKLSEELRKNHESGNFGEGLHGLWEKAKELEEALLLATLNPMQPVINGRFKENKIVSYCLDNETDMNRLPLHSFNQEDIDQFYQLIGYSLCGYASLSRTSDVSCYRAAENLK